jgi:hypothetical protein
LRSECQSNEEEQKVEKLPMPSRDQRVVARRQPVSQGHVAEEDPQRVAGKKTIDRFSVAWDRSKTAMPVKAR